MNILELVATLSLNAAAYIKGLKDAEDTANKGGGRIGKAFHAVGDVAKKSLLAASAASALFVKESIATGKSFDTAMSQVAATMGKSVGDITDIKGEQLENVKKYMPNMYKEFLMIIKYRG